METSRFIRAGVAALALVGAGLAVASPAGASVADSPTSSVLIGSPAQLRARGVVATVPVEVTCENVMYLYVVVAETGPARPLAQGYRSMNLVCTGAPQQVDVNVEAAFNGEVLDVVPFRKGTAHVVAELWSSGTKVAYDERDIEIVK